MQQDVTCTQQLHAHMHTRAFFKCMRSLHCKLQLVCDVPCASAAPLCGNAMH